MLIALLFKMLHLGCQMLVIKIRKANFIKPPGTILALSFLILSTSKGKFDFSLNMNNK